MAVSRRPAVVVLTRAGLPVARRVCEALGEGEIVALADKVGGADRSVADVAGACRSAHAEGRPLIGICAAGILVRCLAPVLRDKADEPPVLAVAETGASVVPLLGGHAGANRLARTLAEALGGAAAITTAGDARFAVALDDPPPGWVLRNPADAKAVMAALLDGERVRLAGEADWLRDSRLPLDPDGRLTLRVTTAIAEGDGETLVYHPRALAVGVGCERGAEPEELRALVRASLAEAGLAEAAVGVVVSLDVKADEPAVHDVARTLAAPARFFAAERLEAEAPRLATPSERVFRAVGCHGVAEGAALAAAGPEGRLAVAKRRSARATCAVAAAPAPLDPSRIGRPQGRLMIVGVGPGKAGWRTPEAESWIAAASDLVGYHRYLDLLGPSAAGKTRHGLDLGEETARARLALDLAAAGRQVALVSSGDAGIYAMASLVFELMERESGAARRRVAVAVTPGVSALQAAAARAGAPLGHDFCCISLSDLLTPWPVIERRVRAAAEGDFVVAFYNPVSRRRTTQLAAARDLLLDHRPAATPVVLARNLGRAGEATTVLTLGELEPGAVDMLTLVIVGSSETRRAARGDGGAWVYTPRGYAGGRPGRAAAR